MAEPLTYRARRIVHRAQEEARGLNHDSVGTEHLLLAVIQDGNSAAARVLESLGISGDAVRQRVDVVIVRGEQAPFGRIPFTPQAKRALELSHFESRLLGHHYIGTEHVLLGLIGEGAGVAARVLTGLGADLNGARQRVIRVLDEDRQHGHWRGLRCMAPRGQASFLTMRSPVRGGPMCAGGLFARF